jgi:23S rRNA pseudouridine1911/1915/1917 synthase
MRIEYEDDEIIVVYKEAGLPAQAGRTSRKDLVSELKNYLALSGSGGSGEGRDADRVQSRQGEPYLGIIHRLDQPVEGLLVFAKTPRAAAELSRQVSGKSDMRKVYQAVVTLPDEKARELAQKASRKVITLTDWIVREYGTNSSRIAEEGSRDAKKAELTFRILKMNEDRALAEIHLHTGRHHQIRVQMAHAGMPLAGDRKYGPVPQQSEESGLPVESGMEKEGNYQKDRLCLCACFLQFRHPSTGKKMKFDVEPSFSL